MGTYKHSQHILNLKHINMVSKCEDKANLQEQRKLEAPQQKISSAPKQVHRSLLCIKRFQGMSSTVGRTVLMKFY